MIGVMLCGRAMYTVQIARNVHTHIHRIHRPRTRTLLFTEKSSPSLLPPCCTLINKHICICIGAVCMSSFAGLSSPLLALYFVVCGLSHRREQ